MIFNTFALLSIILLICSNSSAALITTLPDGKINPDIIIMNFHVQNHAQKYFNSKNQLKSADFDIIKVFCFDYYKDILSKESSAQKINVTQLLESSMEAFWQPNNLRNVLNFHNYYQPIKKNLETITNNFEKLTFDDNYYSTFNVRIQESINEHINPLKKACTNALDEFYENINSNNNGINNHNKIDIDCTELCTSICKTFLKKISGATMDIMGPTFFDQIITKFQTHDNKKLYFSIDHLTPNKSTTKTFFKSIIDNNVVFAGCVDYIKSLEEQKYPDLIKFTLQAFISKEAITYYESRLTGKTELSPDDKLEQIQNEAMTKISQELRPSIQEKIRIKKPTLTPSALEDLTNYFQTRLFNNIEYNDYPELEGFLNNAIINLQQDRSYSQEDIISLVNETIVTIREFKENVPKIEGKPPLINVPQKKLVQETIFNKDDLDDIEKDDSDSDSESSKVKQKYTTGSFKLGGNSNNKTNLLNNLEKKELFPGTHEGKKVFEVVKEPIIPIQNQEEQEKPATFINYIYEIRDSTTSDSDTDSESELDTENLFNPEHTSKHQTLGNTKITLIENPEEQKNHPAPNQLNFLKRLYEQYQTLSPLKKILGTATLVATFFIIATLIQKKYQLIH